jgi:hypothetical protein
MKYLYYLIIVLFMFSVSCFAMPTISNISTISIKQMPSQRAGFEYVGLFKIVLTNFTYSDSSILNIGTDTTKQEYFDKKHNQAYIVFTMYLNQNDYWNQLEFKKRLVANITESIKAKYAQANKK